MKLVLRLRRGQAGYSLVELLTVMAILGTVLAGVTTVFVQGSNAELHQNERVQAQIQAGLAFDRLRRDVHCASAATTTTTSTGQSMTLTGCGSGSVSWCTVGSATRYKLYRLTGSTCGATGKLYADYLTSASPFTYTASVLSTSLAKVHADLVVDIDPSTSTDSFELADDIVLRNSTRS